MLRKLIKTGLILVLLPQIMQSQMNLEWLEELKSNVVKVSGAENGFGFIIGENKDRLYLATAAHVILGKYFDTNPPAIGVEFYSDRRIYNATMISFFEDYDLALLEAPFPVGSDWEINCVDFNASIYEDVRFIGRNEDWVISLPGQINRINVGNLYADIIGIQPGCSGAPLINGDGIIGLIIEQDGVQARAIDLSTVRQVINGDRYNYFTLQSAKKQDYSNHHEQDEDYLEFLTWKAAKQKNTIAAYRNYTRQYPNGVNAELADIFIARLQNKEQPDEDLAGLDYEAIQERTSDDPSTIEPAPNIAENPEMDEAQSGAVTEGEMIFVQSGKFIMGCTEEQINCDRNEIAHEVFLDDFFISRFEVTNQQFAEFLNEEGNREEEGKTWINEKADFLRIEMINGKYAAVRGFEDHPVVGVSWNGANAFCRWKTKKTGYTYRLPTEAEWEYAARGGHLATATQYAGAEKLEDVGWFVSNSDGQTHPVGQKSPNELGIYDMSGNVWEWCNDWYGSDFYTTGDTNNPKGPLKGNYRSIRGGSWYNFAWICRVGLRYNSIPNAYFNSIGFRCVKIP